MLRCKRWCCTAVCCHPVQCSFASVVVDSRTLRAAVVFVRLARLLETYLKEGLSIPRMLCHCCDVGGRSRRDTSSTEILGVVAGVDNVRPAGCRSIKRITVCPGSREYFHMTACVDYLCTRCTCTDPDVCLVAGLDIFVVVRHLAPR